MNLPQHVVIVPDGNRRWAKEKNKPSILGHRQGAKGMQTIAEKAVSMGIPCLTIWGCSVANVTERSPQEVKFLYQLFDAYFKKLAKNKSIHKNEVKVNVIGRWDEFFPEGLKKSVRNAMKVTEKYSKHQLTLLMAYSGVDEMKFAVQAIVNMKQNPHPPEVTNELIKEHLWSKNLPAVDLVIRTGGEPHWSAGMLMWDVAEARLYFTKTFWPDFDEQEFEKAVGGYSKTERRFGK
jgi:undecaprenyl diphosphate synthase